MATCQLLFGKIYTYYNPKVIFLSMVFVFEVGSALCGAAPSSTSFIVGRAIAGLGSSGIMSGAIIVITRIVPLAKRPSFMACFGAVFGISSVVGTFPNALFSLLLSNIGQVHYWVVSSPPMFLGVGASTSTCPSGPFHLSFCYSSSKFHPPKSPPFP